MGKNSQNNLEIVQEITEEIFSSKGYSHLSPDVIQRVVADLIRKYKPKDLIKEVKNKLHQIWGAFYDKNPNFDKILSKTTSDPNFKENQNQIFDQIISLHSSTAERKVILPYFYQQIFDVCQGAKSVVEYGCGLNPLSLVLAGFQKNIDYIGYDIDQKEVDFLNQVFQSFDILNFKTECADIFTQELPQKDIAFLLKLLTTLEQQKKGISLEILNKLPNKWIVASFPVFSIGRKNRNMGEFYKTWFEELVTKLDFKTKVVKLEFETELVFVIEKC